MLSMTERTRPCACGGEIVKKPGPGRWPQKCETCRAPKPPELREVTCEQCGSLFRTSWVARPHRRPKYCSDECKRLAACRRAREWSAAHPERVAELNEEKAAAARQRTLDRAAAKSCPYCDGPMPPRRRKHCGAPKCRHQYNNERMREFMREHKAENGTAYNAKYRTADHAAKLAALPKIPEKMTARRQEGWQRRRARKLQAPTELFRHEDVYERDGWICGLCREPVDRGLRYPDPMSSSLDHILPLSRGGHHVLENVQLAHLTCNVKKHARVAKEA